MNAPPPDRRNPQATAPRRIVRGLLIAAGCAVLALAFIGYLQPSFIVDLANRMLLCM